MDQRTQFMEKITDFTEYASSKGNEVSMEEVVLHFKDLIEDESQYQFIYDYLETNKIRITGWHHAKPQASPSQEDVKVEFNSHNESEEELHFIEMYMNELEAIPPLSESERNELIIKLNDGDTDVINRLVEAHLNVVAEIAKKFRNQGVTYGDLIQEGNIGLMLALSEYPSKNESFDSFINGSIHSAMENTINSQLYSDRIGKHLADRLNQLDNATNKLSESLGRVPEVKELADEMGISEDEVSILLKTSLDTLSVNE